MFDDTIKYFAMSTFLMGRVTIKLLKPIKYEHHLI
jgi:hypothetical protein